jgi:hypothetical protein
MNKPKIYIDVFHDGTTKVEAVGFQGKDCLAATAAIEAALGKSTGRELKPEFHAQVTDKNRLRQQTGN